MGRFKRPLKGLAFSIRGASVAAPVPSEEAACLALDAFDERLGSKYPGIVKMWRARRNEVVPFLGYPPEIRRILYTTNAVESLNFQLRKSLRPKGYVPSDHAVLKVVSSRSKTPASNGSPRATGTAPSLTSPSCSETDCPSARHDRHFVVSDAGLADAPLAYWRFGEFAVSIAQDKTGNGRSASFGGGFTLGAPVAGSWGTRIPPFISMVRTA